MNKITAIFLLSTMLSIAAQADNRGELTIQVDVSGGKGKVIAYLFQPGGDPMHVQTATRQTTAMIKGGRAEIRFDRLAYGEYAFSVFHDINDNDVLDHNGLHLPAEPLGFSNHFHLGIFSGLPSFDKLKFTFAQATTTMEIDLR